MFVSKLGRLVGRLQFHRYVDRSQLYGTSRLPSPSKVISLKLILPPSAEVQEMSFDSGKALERYLGDGALCTVDATGKPRILDPDKYQDLSPLDTYTIATPYHSPLKNVQQYLQTCDKMFENKAREAMLHFMNDAGMAFKELDRVIKDGERVVAEWEAVFDVDGHGVFFLECKHKVTEDVLYMQKRRMKKSLKALKKPEAMGKIFVGGEYWEDGDELMAAAREEFGYGVLHKNGKDLTVLP